jgi:GxxExxY protein
MFAFPEMVLMGLEFREPSRELDDLARTVIGAGLKVHRVLGPGLLESAYEHCLVHELSTGGVDVRRQAPLPILYEGVALEEGYRIDLLVGGSLIVEVKSVEALSAIHQAQLMTYLKLSGRRLGLLLNFNVVLFKHGVRRVVDSPAR